MKKTKKFLAGALALAGIVSMLFLAACPEDPAVPAKYNITKGNSDGGNFTINPTSAASGAKITLTVTPDADFNFDSFIFSPDSITAVDEGSGIWSFTMPASPVTVSAVFIEIPAGSYTITKGTTSPGGTFDISPTVAAPGATITLTAKPDEGKDLLNFTTDPSVTLNGTGNVQTFVMPDSNVVVSAEFGDDDTPRSAITKGTVTPADTGDFTITVTGVTDLTQVRQGVTVTVTATPITGYELDEFTSTPTVTFTANATNKNVATFIMPGNAITINATFVKGSYNVTKGAVTPAGAGDFTITPASPVEFGATVTLKATENTGFAFTRFNVNPAQELTEVAPDEFTFTMPGQAVTVTATFGVRLLINKGTVTGGDLTFSHAEASAGATVTITVVPTTAGHVVNQWNIYPPLETPPVVDTTDPNKFTFIMPGTAITVGADIGPAGTDLLPAYQIEPWDFPAGPWEEGPAPGPDVYYWKYPREGYQGYAIGTNPTIYGTFTDTASVSRRGTSMQWVTGATAQNWFGARYTRASGIVNNRKLNLTGYTHVSIWVKASAIPTTAAFRFNFDTPPAETRYGFSFNVTAVDVWEEILVPLAQVVNTGGTPVAKDQIEGYNFNFTGGTTGFTGTVWLSNITARALP